ncbi:hypothetical protein TTRE_0000015101, partial [Trichuris trichiura]
NGASTFSESSPGPSTSKGPPAVIFSCGKTFASPEMASVHAARVGHVNFSESTEAAKVLTPEEAKQRQKEFVLAYHISHGATFCRFQRILEQIRLDREAMNNRVIMIFQEFQFYVTFCYSVSTLLRIESINLRKRTRLLSKSYRPKRGHLSIVRIAIHVSYR